MGIGANVALVALLLGAYFWTPWASLALAALSSVAFGYVLVFEREFANQAVNSPVDKVSVIIGALVSFAGVCVSATSLLTRV